jgi:hypothetical protein
VVSAMRRTCPVCGLIANPANMMRHVRARHGIKREGPRGTLQHQPVP